MMELSAFFESYRLAVESMNPKALTEHFVYPIEISNDEDGSPVLEIRTEEDAIKQMEELVAMHRSVGASSARIVYMTPTEFSGERLQVHVLWTLCDCEGTKLYDFSANYTLAKIDEVLRISALSTNEVARYHHCRTLLQSAAVG